MRSFNKLLGFIPIVILTSPILSSCQGNPQDGTIYLKVLNSEDYIYKYDAKEAAKEGGNKRPDLTVQFEQEMAKEGKKVKVIYDTFDTMENMYNTLKTGKTSYDLICASEYMLQKLRREEVDGKPLIQELDQSSIPNYYNENYEYGINSGCSPYIRDKLQNIPSISGKSIAEVGSLDKYAVCYMWGTLGILYNPNYKMLKDRGLSEETISNAMNDWGSLWDSRFKKSISIKDSMRDTYAIGVMHLYKSEFDALHNKHKQGLISDDVYKSELSKLFNRGGEEDTNYVNHINEVKNDLLKLRENVFGFEVDSGKQDIITNKIGIDTAWSGDAVYSMDQADEAREKDPDSAPILYYAIPEVGTNLWFDCWAMQSKCSGENKIIANKFLNFISDPKNAKQNMDYIGYTSPIAGEETFDYFDEIYSEETPSEETEEYDVSYFFNKKGDVTSGVHTFDVLKSEINRQIAAQFPKAELKDKLMIMQDYGKNNDLILKMWEQVKHESLPTWAIILLSCEAAIAGAAITIFVVLKVKDKNRRKNRRSKLVESK